MSIFTVTNANRDVKVFDDAVYNRIYAFIIRELDKLPVFDEPRAKGLIKVGDTTQPGNRRMKQWKRSYESINFDEVVYRSGGFSTENGLVFYRDYSVFTALEELFGAVKLIRYMRDHEELFGSFDEGSKTFNGVYISQELLFFEKNVENYCPKKILDVACDLIEDAYRTGVGKYKYRYYDESKKVVRSSDVVERDKDYSLRGYQRVARDEILEKFSSGVDSVLLSAPTRSGKCFISLNVALAYDELHYANNTGDGRLYLVASGITDVRDEWINGAKEHKLFENFEALHIEDLRDFGEDKVSNILKTGKNVLVFLSLQDLNGSRKGKKSEDFTAHNFLKREQVEILFLDESHFAINGTASKEYASFYETGGDELKPAEKKEVEEAIGSFEAIRPKKVLNISATPFNALANNEFDDSNTVFISQKDVEREDELWRENMPEGANDWDAPCFGMPHTVWFALDNPIPMSELFKLDGNKLANPKNVESFIEGFFKPDSGVLVDKYARDAGIGKHILMTPQYKDQAKNLKKVLEKVFEKFGLSDQYCVRDVSNEKNSNKRLARETREWMAECEEQGKKTVLISVDRLNTGVTLPLLDTVMILRELKSAQKFVQIAGRVGSAYVIEQYDDEGEVFKTVGKPNACVICFDRDMLFEVNTKMLTSKSVGRKNNVSERIEEAVSSQESYVVDINHKTLRVTPTDIINFIRESIVEGRETRITNSFFNSLASSISNSDVAQLFSSVEQEYVGGSSAPDNLFVHAFEADGEEDSRSKCRAVDSDGNPCDGKPFVKNVCEKHYVAIMEEKRRRELEESVDGSEEASGGKDSDDSTVDSDNLTESEIKLKARSTMYLADVYACLSVERFGSYAEIVEHVKKLYAPPSVSLFGDPIGDSLVSNRERDLVEKIGLSPVLLEIIVNKSNDTELMDTMLQIRQDTYVELENFDKLSFFDSPSNTTVITPARVANLLVDKVFENVSFDEIVRLTRKGVVDIACKSGVILVAFYKRVKDELEKRGQDSEWLKDCIYALPVSDLTEVFVRETFENYGWNLDNILTVPDGVARFDVIKILNIAFENGNFENGFDFDKIVLAIKRNKKLTNYAEDKVREVASMVRKFGLCVSNPPYQIDTGGKRHQVYPLFYGSASIVSDCVVMIFPIGWQRSTGRGSGSAQHSAMREDKTIVFVDNYYEDKKTNEIVLFDAGTSGVNIVLRKSNYDNDGRVKLFEYGKFVEDRDLTDVKYWSERTQEVFDKVLEWMNDNSVEGMDTVVLPWGGAYSADNASWTDNTRELASHFTDEYNSEDSYKVLGKVKKGPYVVKNVNKKAPTLNMGKIDSIIDKWKLAWFVAAGGASAWRKYQVADPGTVFTNAFVPMEFDTKSDREGFETYFKTLFYRFGFSECGVGYQSYRSYHRFVPDLSTITNPRTGRIGWDSDWTDDDLQELFKEYLTVEDWEYIKQTALDSDGGRQ